MTIHQEKDIYIVGCGAAGMLAGITASGRGLHVGILDANPSPGRKLAATGSGRGNLTNMAVSAAAYDCTNSDLLAEAFSLFDQKKTRELFDQLGIPTIATDDGWVYPLSGSAANVVDTLFSHLVKNDVSLKFHTLITNIKPLTDGFLLRTPDPDVDFSARQLIISAGSPAYPQLGARDNLFKVIAKLGHTVNTFRPALAPIELAKNPFQKLQGMRVDAGVKILFKGKTVADTFGNIIFTSWGINGPGVMNISHHIHRYPVESCQLSIDFFARDEFILRNIYEKLQQTRLPLRVMLNGFFPAKVCQFLLQIHKLDPLSPISSLDQKAFEALIKGCKDLRVAIKGTRGFKFSQLASGGIPLDEVNPRTMASKRVPGLYLAGEILDVVGPCGGYNLQWAFTSGYLAGKGAETFLAG
jgi:predicted Rossmann fold flavoprotein